MSRIRAAIDFVFPTITPFTDAQRQLNEDQLRLDQAAIDAMKLQKSPDLALQQAQRAMDIEMDRRRGAEGKATTYLAVLAALVPLTLSIESAHWERKLGPTPDWLRLSLLSIAVVYTAAAGWYAVRTLKVGSIHLVGVSDISAAWKKGSSPTANLVRETLHCARASQGAINAKVTCIKVTHEHLLRAFIFFIALLLSDPIAYATQQFGLILEPPHLQPKSSVCPRARNDQTQSTGLNLSPKRQTPASPPPVAQPQSLGQKPDKTREKAAVPATSSVPGKTDSPTSCPSPVDSKPDAATG